MRRAIHRIPLLALVGVLAAPVCSAEVAKAPAGTGLAGGWKLTSTRDDVDMKPVKESWNPLGGAETPGGTGSRGTGGGFDIPLEVMTDARRLAVTDDGTRIDVTYPSGRKRTFVTDGTKRRFDDGDGPADVTGHRAGTTVTVFSEWFRGYKLKETWELRDGPRRLVVRGKLKGRESQEYVRSYEPLPPGEPVFTPTPAPASEASAGAEALAAALAPPPPTVDRMAECTIHPPRNSREDELTHLARVRQEEASKAADRPGSGERDLPGEADRRDLVGRRGLRGLPRLAVHAPHSGTEGRAGDLRRRGRREGRPVGVHPDVLLGRAAESLTAIAPRVRRRVSAECDVPPHPVCARDTLHRRRRRFDRRETGLTRQKAAVHAGFASEARIGHGLCLMTTNGRSCRTRQPDTIRTREVQR